MVCVCVGGYVSMCVSECACVIMIVRGLRKNLSAECTAVGLFMSCIWSFQDGLIHCTGKHRQRKYRGNMHERESREKLFARFLCS